MNKIIYLNSGRSALDIGIKLLSLKKNTNILVPEIICDVVIEILLKNKLKIIYYKLDNKFRPIWSDLYKKSFNKISCILMVHFFGYPQNLSKFKELTKRKKIYLIEDNCHSLNISYKGNILGTNGDIGIDAPRKIISNLYSGGRLFINKGNNYNFSDIKKYNPNIFERIKMYLKNNFPIFVKKIKFFGNRPNFEYPYLSSSNDINFSLKLMDQISKNKLDNINLNKESFKRKVIFKRINNFAIKNSIKPLFRAKANMIPMYFVGVAKNQEHATKIFDWGWNKNIEIVSWPSFHKNNKLSNDLKKRWSKYVCFPLNQQFLDKWKDELI